MRHQGSTRVARQRYGGRDIRHTSSVDAAALAHATIIRRPVRASLGGGGRVRWPTRPGQQAAVCPPPILEIESERIGKIFETGPRLSNSLPQREPDCPLAPGARHASCSKASTRCRAHFSSAPRLRAERPDNSLAGSAGQLHVARRGRIRWVMWRRCRTCPCATLETPPGPRGHRPHLPYLMLPRRRVGASKESETACPWRGAAHTSNGL